MKYYELNITKSSKSRNGKEHFGIYDEAKELFETLESAKEYLKENYPCKKRKSYIDSKKGERVNAGLVFSFIGYDDNSKQYIEEHWVDLYKVNKEYVPLH
jgi:hypothetical protein